MAPTTTIEQETEVQGQPAVTITADLAREYVASYPNALINITGAYVRALPAPTDRFLRDFGAKIYTQDMMLDPQVYSTLMVKATALWAQGVQVLTPARFRDDPKAEEVTRFSTNLLNGLQTSFVKRGRELTKGMIQVGNKVGELVWEVRTWEGKQRVMLRDIKPRPYDNLRFVTDDYYNLLGFMYVGAGSYIFEGPLLPNSDMWARVIPAEKFLVLSNNDEDSDKRGRSDMAPLYTPWWKKQQITPAHLSNLATFGQPSLWGELAPDTPAMVDAVDAKGVPTGEKVSSVFQLNGAIDAFKNGSSAAGPHDWALHLVEAQGNGEAFLKAYEHEDKQIAKGMLWQTLTTEESAHMARAASSTHQDVLSMMIRAARSDIEYAIQMQILQVAIRYNYPASYLQYLPEVSLGNPDTQDLAKLWTGAGNLTSSGFVTDPEQKQQIDSRIGLPIRSQEAVDRELALKAAATTAARELNPGGNQTGSGQGKQGTTDNPQKDNNPNGDNPERAGQNG